MALSDPQTITVEGEAVLLPRVSTGQNQSQYLSEDGNQRLTVSHAYGRRTRRVVRLDHSKISPDPYLPSQNVKLSMSNYLVFDVPAVGFTNLEARTQWVALHGLLTASSGALISKLLGGES